MNFQESSGTKLSRNFSPLSGKQIDIETMSPGDYIGSSEDEKNNLSLDRSIIL